RLEEAGEVAIGVVGRDVMIHDLPEQLNFFPAALCRLPYLGQDVCLRPHSLVTTRIWADAKAAKLVAPFDDRHVGLERIAPPRHSQRKRHILVRIEVQLWP